MKYLKYYYIIIILIITSCDNYLDLKSDASLVVPQTLNDIEGLLDDSQRMNYNSYPTIGQNLTDEFVVSDEVLNLLPENSKLIYTWQLKNYTMGSDWGASYKVVYVSNLVLEILSTIERTNSNQIQWDRIKGTALFFRSFVFLALVTQYGHAYDENTSKTQLGIPLRLQSDVNVKSTRATIAECYNQIIQDLTESIDLLPNYSSHVMRPSKGSVFALLARTHLFMRNYNEVLRYSNLALELNSNLIDFNNQDEIGQVNTAYPFKKYNKETIFYAQTAGYWGSYSSDFSYIDTLLISQYKSGDLRKKYFFNKKGDQYYFKGSYSGANPFFVGITTSELYLMRAEASAFMNNITGAMDDLNYLLKTRFDNSVPYNPILANDKTTAIRLIRNERKKELIIRNLRWIDIKRYNLEGDNIILKRIINGEEYTLYPNDPYYAFPLPDDIIKMTGMPQN